MPDSIAAENWQHYSNMLPKRKRADLVCFACHSKKVKCDLQQQKNDGRNTCKNCSTAGRECTVRPSKREKRRRTSKDEPSVRDEQDVGFLSSGVDALLAADASYQTFSGNQATNIPGATTKSDHSQLLECTQPLDFQARGPTQAMLQTTRVPNLSPISQREPIGTNLSDTTPTQTGDVDTGFLQVYAQENQFDAENQALVAQLEHRYCSDIRPDLEQIFTDTYFSYCYPWCPVLDRNTLSSDVARSPLLANALALAGSHIQPPLLPHDGPETYYKRARTIFYDDEEADETVALKSLCLFYWWAPQAPSRVHRHSYVLLTTKLGHS